MSEEVHELHEQAEHARHNPSLAPVTLTMAVLAVLVATVSLLGHRAATDAIILQNKVTDQWAYYQAKNGRLHTDELFGEFAGVVASKDPEAVAKFQEKTLGEAERYKQEKKEMEAKGHELEQEFALTNRKEDRFDLAEVFLEIALVITSITLLSGRRIFWHLGLLLAVGGVVVTCSAWLLK